MKKLVLSIILVGVVGTIAALALSPYFTESTIDEPLPEGAVFPSDLQNQGKMMEETMMEETMMEETMMEETMMEETMMEETMMEETMMEETMMEETMMEEPKPVSYTGTFVGIGDGIHDAQGFALTIPLENGKTVLRLENFKATNGPDLFVYLSTDRNASDFINLGELKASSGNQNYDLPSNVDLGKYNKVLIWCKAFGVLFGSAELSIR